MITCRSCGRLGPKLSTLFNARMQAVSDTCGRCDLCFLHTVSRTTCDSVAAVIEFNGGSTDSAEDTWDTGDCPNFVYGHVLVAIVPAWLI